MYDNKLKYIKYKKLIYNTLPNKICIFLKKRNV